METQNGERELGLENFLIHAGRRRGFRWRRGRVLTVKYWVSIHFHLSLILKLTRSLGWVLSCRVKLHGASFRCVILCVLWRRDWSDKEVAVGELLEGCFSDSVEIMVAFSWVTVGD